MTVRFKRWLDLYIGSPTVLILFPFVRTLGWILRRNHDLSACRSLCFVKLMGGGSLTMLYPTLVALKQHRPGLRLGLLCTPSVKPFADLLGVFDLMIVIDDRGPWRLLTSSLAALWQFFRRVDVSVDMELHSRLTTIFTTIAITRSRVGLIDHNSLWRRRLYTHSIFVNPQSSIYSCYEALTRLFHSDPIPIERVRKAWKGTVVPVESENHGITGDYVVIALGCSDLSVERRLAKGQWQKILLALHRRSPQSRCVFLGNRADAIATEQVLEGLPPEVQQNCDNLCGQTSLKESVGLIATARAMVAIDSALLHLARWSGCPVVGFWGPTRPDQLLRPMDHDEVHFYRRLNCSPCVHLTVEPPCQGKNICMSFDDELQAAVEWVAKRTPVTATQTPLTALVYGPDRESQFIL